jgi:uncharacterized damage-inducible protein DinB
MYLISSKTFRAVAALVLVAAACLLLSGTAYAADGPKASFITDFTGQFDYVKAQILSLENAMPQDKFSWRPGKGIRSVSEVYLHIANSNTGILGVLGLKGPAPVDEKSVTDKAKIAENLKTSFEWTKDQIAKMTEADLDKSVNFFGRSMTTRSVIFILLTHVHEHLGQSIAYARVNGVVPPWSEPRQQKPPEKK